MTLINHLNTLESTGLIRLITAQPELEYLFRHALVQDAAYGSLLKQDRKQLHLAVGEALERLYPEQQDEQAATLAYHFEKAEVRDKAIQYLSRAGERAQAGYANTEAIDFYRAAISQVEQILNQANEAPETWREQLARLFASLADVLELIGQHEAARNTYGQALTAFAQLAQPKQIEESQIYRKLGLAHTMSGQHQEAQQAWDQAEQALGLLPSEADQSEQTQARWREWIEIQVERAWNYYWQYQTDEMKRVSEMVLPVMERYGTPVQYARVTGVLYLARLQRDRYLPSDETLALGQDALTAALAAGKSNLLFDGQFGVGLAHLMRRELDRAEGPLRACLEVAGRTGDAVRKSRCVTYLMMLARMRGQVAETRSHIPQVLDLAWAGQMISYTYTAKACLAWIAWREGDLAEAREQACAGLELLQGPFANNPTQWLALWPLLAVATTEQNFVEAIESARALLHPTQARLPDMLTAALEAAIDASEQNQTEEICAQLHRAMNLAQEMGYL